MRKSDGSDGYSGDDDDGGGGGEDDDDNTNKNGLLGPSEVPPNHLSISKPLYWLPKKCRVLLIMRIFVNGIVCLNAVDKMFNGFN